MIFNIRKKRMMNFLFTIIVFIILGVLLTRGVNLPTVGGHIDSWGTILNAYLQAEHGANGTHTNITATSLNVTGDLIVNTSNFYVNTTNGRIGIGTANPNATLHINNPVAGNNTFTVYSDGGHGEKQRFTIENSVDEPADLDFRNVVVNIGNPDPRCSTSVSFNWYSNGSSYQPIRIYRGGSTTITNWYLSDTGGMVSNVGGQASYAWTVRTYGADYSRFLVSEFGNLEWAAADGTTATDTILYRFAANKLRINDTLLVNDKVGIGTTAPTQTLTVQGTANFTGGTSGAAVPIILSENGTAIPCNSSNAGGIIYSASKHYGCDGTNWNAFY